MLPICYATELGEKMEFDLNWFDFENTAKETTEINKEKKFLHLKNLVLNKRKRSSIHDYIPYNLLASAKTKVNPRELLRSHFRLNPESQRKYLMTIFNDHQLTGEG